MRLNELNLANFKGFEQLDLDFEKDITVLAGMNGIGKSSILSAICVILSRALPEFTPSRAKPRYFEDDDIYLDKTALEVFLSLSVADQPLDVGIQRVRSIENESDRFFLLRPVEGEINREDFKKVLQSRTLTGNLKEGEQETRKILSDLKKTKNQPIAIYFSPRRRLPGKPRTMPEQKPFNVVQAYSFALDEQEVELRYFLHWFNTQAKLDKQQKVQKNVLNTLQSVVTAFIPEFTNLRLEENPRLAFVIEKNGKPFQLHQLSDGERGLLAIVFDLTRRLAIANPESTDPIKEGCAVVMVDEIELHLHPTWQRRVLERLTATFKNCQFIVTTHSPLVLGEVQARCVRFLEREEDTDKVISTIPSEAYGLDANQMLSRMGALERNEEVIRNLRQLYRLIDDEDFDEARKAMTPLIEKLGESDPEITRARSLIKFLEGGE